MHSHGRHHVSFAGVKLIFTILLLPAHSLSLLPWAFDQHHAIGSRQVLLWRARHFGDDRQARKALHRALFAIMEPVGHE